MTIVPHHPLNVATLRKLADLTAEERVTLTAASGPARDALLARLPGMREALDEATRVGEQLGAEDAAKVVAAYRLSP